MAKAVVKRRRSGMEWSQADARRGQRMNDQFGRPWFAEIEIRSGEPTGLIDPLFKAPIYPPQQYIRVDDENPLRLFIDLREWFVSALASHRQYQRRAEEEASKREWELTYNEKGRLASIPPRIQHIIGKPPKPLEPIVAMLQGNKRALGFTKTPDPRLEHLFPKVINPADAALAEFDFSDESLSDYLTAEGVQEDVISAVLKPIVKPEPIRSFDSMSDDELDKEFNRAVNDAGLALDEEELMQDLDIGDETEEIEDAEAIGTQTGRPVPMRGRLDKDAPKMRGEEGRPKKPTKRK